MHLPITKFLSQELQVSKLKCMNWNRIIHLMGNNKTAINIFYLIFDIYKFFAKHMKTSFGK